MLFQDNPFSHLFELSAGIYLKTKRIVSDALKPLGLTYSQFGALIALMQSPELRQTELAKMLETDTTNTMVICDSLEKKGLLIRIADPEDRRANRLRMTDAGRMRFLAAIPAIEQCYEPMLTETDNDSILLANGALEKIYAAIKKRSEVL